MSKLFIFALFVIEMFFQLNCQNNTSNNEFATKKRFPLAFLLENQKYFYAFIQCLQNKTLGSSIINEINQAYNSSDINIINLLYKVYNNSYEIFNDCYNDMKTIQNYNYNNDNNSRRKHHNNHNNNPNINNNSNLNYYQDKNIIKHNQENNFYSTVYNWDNFKNCLQERLNQLKENEKINNPVQNLLNYINNKDYLNALTEEYRLNTYGNSIIQNCFAFK